MDKTVTFEESMKLLEAIVRELESGNLTLEQSLAKYAEGVKLAKTCRDLLQNAEELIVKMEQESGWVDFRKTEE
jgi:exodeoxyribonuclease VII small subunit